MLRQFLLIALFRDYLFKCGDERITVTASAYGDKHTAFPLCNTEGAIIAVIDINLGALVELPQGENREVQRLIKLLNDAHKEVDEDKDDTAVLGNVNRTIHNYNNIS